MRAEDVLQTEVPEHHFARAQQARTQAKEALLQQIHQAHFTQKPREVRCLPAPMCAQAATRPFALPRIAAEAQEEAHRGFAERKVADHQQDGVLPLLLA